MLGFLTCRTPDAWLSKAVEEIPTLLLDHAGLELRAAQQAQKLIRRYGSGAGGSAGSGRSDPGLLGKMSRLAREELRHFEQVLAILKKKGIAYRPLSASRYAGALHAHIRQQEPGRLVDTLIVAAIIEARSCERFGCLSLALESQQPELAHFYQSLVGAESRHFQDYLTLGATVARTSVSQRAGFFLERERALILEMDPQLRFHSGIPE